jgi:hypothetical protein
MTSNKFIKLAVKLNNDTEVTLYLGAGNFSVLSEQDHVYIADGTHPEGGWKLHSTESYVGVVSRIDQAMQGVEMLARPYSPDYKNM